MADPRKNQTLVVVVTLLALLSPAYCFDSTDLQEYTQEISKRSFAMMDGVSSLLATDGWLMSLLYPCFVIATVISSINALFCLIAERAPMIGNMLGYAGAPLGMLAGFPHQEVAQARDGENRNQRLLDHVADRVTRAVFAGQSRYESDLK